LLLILLIFIIQGPEILPWKSKNKAFQERKEKCLNCHSEIQGLSESHNPLKTGCYTCHLGDTTTLDKAIAHKNMILVPGNLSNVALTCGKGNCHGGIMFRIDNSMMTRLSGIIGVDKYVFNECANPDCGGNVKDLQHSAADVHLRNLCAGCHLGMDKPKPGPAPWLERGGGCNACHLDYYPEALKDLQLSKKQSDYNFKFHPAIDLKVTDDKCRSCHSRSGRISLAYEGWTETSLAEDQVKNKSGYKTLPDKRVIAYIQPDIHFQKGMNCIDCHGSYELMGDGNQYLHKEDAVNIQCIDCHSDNNDNQVKFDKIDNESQKIIELRNLAYRDKSFLQTKKNQRPILNSFIEKTGQKHLITKLTSKNLELRPPASICKNSKVHKRLSCEACHTAWVPHCIGCHNSYETETVGWDMTQRKNTHGSWIEYAGKFMTDPPTLGIRDSMIYTMTPGMILSVDLGSFGKQQQESWKRLYAPASGHTIQKKGRSCKSCHNDPLAIGYGRGNLAFRNKNGTGFWEFTAQFSNNEHDGLPEDAWIPFLKERKGITATRLNIRPFNQVEQKKILRVGSCLTCHDEGSSVMQSTLTAYAETLNKMSKKCVIQY
jgi:hypothetical protein